MATWIARAILAKVRYPLRSLLDLLCFALASLIKHSLFIFSTLIYFSHCACFNVRVWEEPSANVLKRIIHGQLAGTIQLTRNYSPYVLPLTTLIKKESFEMQNCVFIYFFN